MKTLAAKEIAAEAVSNCEGKAIHTIIGFELTLEISTPKVVWGQDRAGGFAWVTDPASPAGDGNHPMAFEDIADGGSAGKIPMGMMIMDDLEDLFTAPRGMLVP